MEQYVDMIFKSGLLNFLIIHSIFGFLGGVGSIFLSGNYTKSHWVMEGDKKVKLIFGSIKEPFIGLLSGVLIPLPVAAQTSYPLLISLSMIAGFGSSSFLKKYIQGKTQEIIDSSVADFDSLSIGTEDDSDASKEKSA